jgi:hypothetical protein
VPTGLMDLRQVKFQPRQNQRIEFASSFSAAVQFVAAFLELEDFDGSVGWIAEPVFLHAEAGIKFLFIVAVATNAGR